MENERIQITAYILDTVVLLSDNVSDEISIKIKIIFHSVKGKNTVNFFIFSYYLMRADRSMLLFPHWPHCYARCAGAD